MSDTPKGSLSERGGCLIAWLILLLLVLGVGSIAYFAIGIVLGGQGMSEEAGFSIALSVAFSIGAAGAAALLSRRRYGFYLLAASFVFASLLQALNLRVEFALAGAFNIGVIWWLLKPVWHKLD